MVPIGLPAVFLILFPFVRIRVISCFEFHYIVPHCLMSYTYRVKFANLAFPLVLK